MSRKPFIGLLIVVVLIVWGAVAYRFMRGRSTSGKGEAMARDASGTVHAAPDSILGLALRLDYRDPFLDRPSRTLHPNIVQPERSEEKSLQRPAFEWADIRYKGMVGSVDGRSLTGLVAVDGKDALVHEGDRVGSVRIQRILPDSMIAVSSGGAERRVFRVRP